jgi:DNA invertase Pin-like site-specific DNA recombinase
LAVRRVRPVRQTTRHGTRRVPVAEVDFVSHQEALDTSTPMGKAMFTIIAAMAELERSVIRERVIAGLDYAQTHGTKSGKPVGHPRVICRRYEVVRLRDEQGYSWGRIKRELGISTGTAGRVYLAAKSQKPCGGAAIAAPNIVSLTGAGRPEN